MAHWLIVTAQADGTAKASQAAGDIALADLLDGTDAASSRSDTITWRSHSTTGNQATDEATYDGVWISESVSSATLGTKYESYAIPVVLGESGAVVNLNFASGATSNSGNAARRLAVAGHPIGGGLTQGSDYSLISAGSTRLSDTAEVGAGATLIWAENSGLASWVIYCYDAGTAMGDGNNAEAKRVAVLITEPSYSSLTSDGKAVILGVAEYSVGSGGGAPVAPKLLTLLGVG